MTKYADNHTRAKMVQIGYEELITSPDDTREDLYCLTMPQTKALIAVIDIYRYRTRWWYDDLPDLDLLRQFVDDTQRRLMMPCGDDNTILLSQFTPDGHYQTSPDGGETWSDTPERDPRNSVPLPPPYLPPDTTDESCTYADSVVNVLIEQWIHATADDENQQTVIDGIIGFLAGIFGAVGNIPAVIVLAIAITVVAFTIAAWKAAFVTEVWDRLRCNIKDNIGEDGSFTQDNVDSIYSRIQSEETGIVQVSLAQMVAALGWQGMTIAARRGYGSATADCSCGEGCEDSLLWDIKAPQNPDQGSIISTGRTASNLQIDGLVVGGDGNYYVQLVAPSSADCCTLTGIGTTGSGAGLLVAWDLCGETPGSYAHSSGTLSDVIGPSICGLMVRTSSPQTVTLSF